MGERAQGDLSERDHNIHGADTVRILAASDHTLFRNALCQLLRAEPDMTVVGETGTGADLIEVVSARRPDIVLLDVTVPDSGIRELVRSLLERTPHPRLLILSMSDSPALVQDLLSLGVSGFLHKKVSQEVLFSAIRTVVQDERHVTVSVSRQSIFALTMEQAPEQAVRLSPREVVVLEHVARALSNRQVAGRLGISEGTVKRHLRNIFEKLGAVSRIDAVNKATAAQLIRQPQTQLDQCVI
ncbi:response regulator transcription factor [Kitasatospora sp. SUK 42]|uniref:response regulator n=1 Tax=Kitasatospora sp. SUK 42 TaxID=1588882 RepID=UPI0018CBD8B7|nr:response regulator transcription factor [Kitasatospora sp. SUK 42]MBV2154802.1 response regulator transcription factor [Kitasatospora sp. SUK 42]